ncbi:MAG TPA: nickel pincer cofactor biosynthesis protein LarC [Chloroflexota bacterium]|nr:nickel pincer cofactor biosynthesis protein LarC [Chloroflexota bacterium]
MPRRVAFFDCFSGASGNMVLGALIDAGADPADLHAGLDTLPIGRFRAEVQRTTSAGLTGTLVRVHVDEPDPPHRSLADIENILLRSTLSNAVRTKAMVIFRRLAAVEASIHGSEIEKVRFHEVGAVDAIVDVVGSLILLERLGVSAIFVSSLPLGHGRVKSSHGVLPLPAPATLALIAEAHAPTRPVDTEAELVTPTGAAILTTLGEFQQPEMRVDAVGTGLGTRALPWPNVLRVWVGAQLESSLGHDDVTLIETNLDDCTPEQAAFAMERLQSAGALDVFFTPIQMKKNRPGMLLSVLCTNDAADSLAGIVLRETTSLGVRLRTMRRVIAQRRTERVSTRFGSMQVKIKTIDGRDVLCPEYEECARIAREHNVPIGEVYAAVYAAGIPPERAP